ncbi:PepSY-associated TM helix domain-containing protein [Helicobacter pylori]|uniref:PepSY-associated TM helix domain-containing protein n=1 Tax=Helicobacter pylori TaxID=210 RepID=UPI001AE8BDBB|nr:PepSY-associated TM helix domain-containing protein [Helicobacter pylori]QTP01508.1 PepSY-associated TM helix domain-containing protein [Helicobacter pylori]
MTAMMRYFHIYATTFFFPLALLFAVSGFSLLFKARQDTGAKIKEWVLEKSLKKEERLDFLKDFIKENHIAMPKKIEPREYRGALVIGTPLYEINLETKGDQTKIKTIERGFLGALIMLHKAKVGIVFKVLLGIFCVFLLLFYLSAFLMVAFKDTKRMFVSVLIGSIVFFGAIYWSL